MATRPITDTLRRIGKGVFLDRISDQLNQLVREVENNGKAGTLVIQIAVSRANRGGALIVAGKSEVKLPKAPPEDALMWSTPEGNLVDRDPNQHELPLREVTPDAGAAGAPLKNASA